MKLLPMPFVGDKIALVKAMLAGHPGAAAAFYDEFSGRVSRTLHAIMGSDEEIADLLQEVFIRGWKGIGRIRDLQRVDSWLMSIAVFVGREELRTRKRRHRLAAFSPERPRDCEQPPLAARRALQEAYDLLNELPLDERMVFVLRHVEGMSLFDTAAACRISLSTVKRRLARADGRFLALAAERPAIADWVLTGTCP
jgi:RNA polymerase sigma-70 factor (ECF subfamily)